MFLRIRKGGTTITIEGTQVHMKRLSEDEVELTVEPIGTTHRIDYRIEESLSVYLMNNQGKTIETIFYKDRGLPEPVKP